MASLSQELQDALARESDDTWKELTKRLLAFVASLLRGRRWRCLAGGVPPDGYDAESITGQAFEQLFTGTDWHPNGNPYSRQELEFELKRIVYNIVRKIERRKENVLTSSEPDLSHNDEEISGETFFNNFAGDSPPADGEMQRKEAKERLQKFQREFKTFLGPNDRLKQIFDCICDGVTKRDDQATCLKITPQDVTNARKRLNRKLDKFAEQLPNYPYNFIQEIKNA